PRVGHAQRRAVEAVDGQPAPAGGGGRRGAPHRGGLREERGQRLGAELVARLDDGGVGDVAPPAVPRRQDEVEMLYDLRDAAIVEQAHPDDEPHHVLRRQLAPSHRRRPGRGERGGDPRRIDGGTELLEARRSLSRADGEYGLPQPHRPHLLWGRPITIGRKKDPEAGRLRLTDRHWPPRRVRVHRLTWATSLTRLHPDARVRGGS